MKTGLKFFAFCFVAALPFFGAQPTPTAREVIKNAGEYVYVIHRGVQGHVITDLILKFGDPRMVTVAADRREYVEELINAGFEVWTSDDGIRRMTLERSAIIADSKYIIDHLGNVTENQELARRLANTFDHFYQNFAKMQMPRPKKKPKPTR